MKALKEKFGRVIDFEGSRKSGIQQASIIDFKSFSVIRSHEFLKGDGDFNDWILDVIDKSPNDFWVSHNISIEKNLLTSQMPYLRNASFNKGNITWGPWVDSLKVYKKLYPNLIDYNLKDLCEIFLTKEEISTLSKEYCKRSKIAYHQSTFDALVTFMLLERLKDKIDLAFFLE